MKILHGFRQFIFEYTSVPSLLGGIRLYDCVKVILLEKHFLTRLCHKGRIRSYWLETKTQNLGHMLALKVHVQIIFWINEKSFLIILPPPHPYPRSCWLVRMSAYPGCKIMLRGSHFFQLLPQWIGTDLFLPQLYKVLIIILIQVSIICWVFSIYYVWSL